MMREISFLAYLLLFHNCLCLGMHALQVKILSYENDGNRLIRSGQYVCCDGNSNRDPCEPCDTYFRYCLRFRNPNRISSYECPNNGRTLVSEVNVDDGPLDFSMSTLLGLPNPFILSGFEDPEDFELLIVALDKDSSTTFEFIDAFRYLLENLRQGQPVVFDGAGENNNIELTMELTLTCVEGYVGELCDQVKVVTTVATESPTTKTITTESPTTVPITTESPTTVPGITTESPTTVPITKVLPTTVPITTKSSPTIISTESQTKSTATMQTEPLTVNVVITNSTESVTSEGLSTGDATITVPTQPQDCIRMNCSEHGVCVINGNNISCSCLQGYTGSLCTERIQMVSEKRGDDVGSIAGGTIGSLTVIIAMALVLGVIITVVVRKKHKRKQVNEEDVRIEQHLPSLIIANDNEAYGMIKNAIYGMRLDTGQREIRFRPAHETQSDIYDNYDQVADESHIYEDMTGYVDHFQMNFNVVYEENEHNR